MLSRSWLPWQCNLYFLIVVGAVVEGSRFGDGSSVSGERGLSFLFAATACL